MALSIVEVKKNYIADMQTVAKQLLQFDQAVSALSDIYVGAALTGTFVDDEVQNEKNSQHMTAADIAQFTTDLNTIRTAITNTIRRNMAKAVGRGAIKS